MNRIYEILNVPRIILINCDVTFLPYTQHGRNTHKTTVESVFRDFVLKIKCRENIHGN